MAKNIITEERYNKIKPHVGLPKDDKKNSKKFGVGMTVLRDIRNTKNFAEYKGRSSTARSKKTTVKVTSKKTSDIIDIIVLLAIAGLVVAVLLIGGK